METEPSLTPPRRRWEVDAVRGIFVALMILYHAGWDLEHFGIYTGPPLEKGWMLAIRQVVGGLFIGLVGVGFVLTEQREPDPEVRRRRWLTRGLKLWLWGLVISAITATLIPGKMVIFGILHLIGTAYLLAPLLLRLGRVTAWAGLLLLVLRLPLRTYRPSWRWLLPLGVEPLGHITVDYFPLVPWLGTILLGIAVGRSLYPAPGVTRLRLPAEPPRSLRPFIWAGRRALLLYLIHQPILFGILALFGFTLW